MSYRVVIAEGPRLVEDGDDFFRRPLHDQHATVGDAEGERREVNVAVKPARGLD